MDVFVEQILQKRRGKREWFTVLAVLIAIVTSVLLVFTFMQTLGAFSLIIFVGVGYGAWWVLSRQGIEMEYSITNGAIDIDQIIARRTRKKLVSVNARKIEEAGRYTAGQMKGRKFDRYVMAASHIHAENLVYFTYRSKANGHTVVVFEPDERVYKAFYDALPRLVQTALDKK